MIFKNKSNNNSGQSLVTLIIFMVMSIFIVTAAVAVIISNSRTTGKFYQGINIYNHAESGIENALIRLLRDPNYSGETMDIDGNQVIIQVTPNGGNTYIVESEARGGNFVRTITASVSYTNNIMAINSWSEN